MNEDNGVSRPGTGPLPGKRPRTVLAGPYGHPFHPILVTVPIGAWVASLIFDVAAIARDDPAPFAEGAFWLLVIGIVGALLAAVFGVLDLLTIPQHTRAASTAIAHLALNTAAVVLFAINVLIRQSEGRDTVSGTGVALTVLGLLIISVSGWLGGKLSYTYGVRVADETTQADAFR